MTRPTTGDNARKTRNSSRKRSLEKIDGRHRRNPENFGSFGSCDLVTFPFIAGKALLRGQLHRGQPEVLDAFDDTGEVVQLHWFADIAIGVKAVGAQNILLR